MSKKIELRPLISGFDFALLEVRNLCVASRLNSHYQILDMGFFEDIGVLNPRQTLHNSNNFLLKLLVTTLIIVLLVLKFCIIFYLYYMHHCLYIFWLNYFIYLWHTTQANVELKRGWFSSWSTWPLPYFHVSMTHTHDGSLLCNN